MSSSNSAETIDSLPILDYVVQKLSHLDLKGKVTFETVASEKGGNADIHKGTLKDDKEKREMDVAVKRLRYKLEDAKIAKDFAREIRVWSDFKHDNIIKFEGYFMEGHFPALVSGWMKDGSLWSFIQKHKVDSDFDRKQALSMVLDIAQGLAYMHNEKKAVHSDLKSDNVLISHDRRALLTDFGISRMDTHTRGYTVTNPSGSIRWNAVELLNVANGSTTKPTIKTDVWAFGMTVYEILSFDRPYSGMGSDIQVALQILGGKCPSQPAFSKKAEDETIERFMWSLCEKCWNPDPEKRPSMGELESSIAKQCGL